MGSLLDRLGLAEPTPHLLGDRVSLRPARAGDWAAWAALRAESRDFLTPWEPTWPHDALTRRGFQRRLRRLRSEARLGWGHSFLIFRRSDAVLLGGVTLSSLHRGVAQSCSVGYWIGAPHIRQGPLRDTTDTILRYVFEHLRLHRLEAACQPENLPSRQLLLAAGFAVEGLAREYLRINGAWRDHVLFGMLAANWRARQSLIAVSTANLAPARSD